MDIQRNGSQPSGKGPAEYFTGTVRVDPLFQAHDAALAGFGLAYVPEELAQSHLKKGHLKRVLEAWCPPYSGYHLYYPSRRQTSPAFALLVDALRYRSSHGGTN